MKKVTDKVWKQKAVGLAEWRKKRTSPPNLELYKRIVSMVHVGKDVLDCGCGQCHLLTVLKDSGHTGDYLGADPFPLNDKVWECSAEQLRDCSEGFDTVFMLSALDNVIDVKASLEGLRYVAEQNIVILTSIGVPPDQNHTHQIDREDLVSVLGEPTQEVEISPKCFLFEWRLK